MVLTIIDYCMMHSFVVLTIMMHEWSSKIVHLTVSYPGAEFTKLVDFPSEQSYCACAVCHCTISDIRHSIAYRGAGAGPAGPVAAGPMLDQVLI